MSSRQFETAQGRTVACVPLLAYDLLRDEHDAENRAIRRHFERLIALLCVGAILLLFAAAFALCLVLRQAAA